MSDSNSLRLQPVAIASNRRGDRFLEPRLAGRQHGIVVSDNGNARAKQPQVARDAWSDLRCASRRAKRRMPSSMLPGDPAAGTAIERPVPPPQTRVHSSCSASTNDVVSPRSSIETTTARVTAWRRQCSQSTPHVPRITLARLQRTAPPLCSGGGLATGHAQAWLAGVRRQLAAVGRRVAGTFNCFDRQRGTPRSARLKIAHPTGVEQFASAGSVRAAIVSCSHCINVSVIVGSSGVGGTRGIRSEHRSYLPPNVDRVAMQSFAYAPNGRWRRVTIDGIGIIAQNPLGVTGCQAAGTTIREGSSR